MRRIKTSTGVAVLVNGDLLEILEVLYHEVTARHDLERSFDDMNKEIANLIGQMTAAELRTYLQEALFVNTITYENQRAAAYIRRVGGRPKKTRAPVDGREPAAGVRRQSGVKRL